ncbi:Beta-barrel assembly-enhancing protease [wastewater metagenome]|uniref:Beta-barrel assembly-enhancing protease n=2 Tax=unclassified sequences TaxID=12908 RepID=A0A5B8RGM1_9ZZZZ|nr:beta-barrel assembly-enhancing protease [uncultured organism]
MLRQLAIATVVALLVVACATSPTGRRQLQLFPAGQMQAMGVAAFKEMKDEKPVLDNKAVTGYVRCVADAITAVVPQRYQPDGDWEVRVFDLDSANAFALPGGKIGVHRGLLEVAKSPDQLAAVIGHEVGHVMADHSNERMSQQFAVGTGLAVAGIIAGNGDGDRQQALALLGLGAEVGVLLPFSRLHESEADTIGLELMARAGFDPRESVALWENMEAESKGAQPPEFLSTHPSHDSRIDGLQSDMPRAMSLYRQAQESGRRPGCKRVTP